MYPRLLPLEISGGGVVVERRMFQGGSAETNLSETSRNRVLSVAYWRFSSMLF